MKLQNPVLLAATLCLAVPLPGMEDRIDDVIRGSLDFAATQYDGMLERIKGERGMPRSYAAGKVVLVPSRDWTSGFFAGGLWLLHEHTGEARWKEQAIRHTSMLEQEKNNRLTHDVGFILYSSYGQGLRLTGNPAYREVLATGAASLATRFNPKVGSLQSWEKRHGWLFPVIIDNMMNLELLFWAAREGGLPGLREMAERHADTTLKNHYRPDGSSFHVVDYDPSTGAIRGKQTHQGTADGSAWARGQAWGLYGFTMCYRETRKIAYLEHAKKIAAFLRGHPRMPADKVPYWDFDAPDLTHAPRDSSAAAIMSAALIELSSFVEPALAKEYLAYAEQQLRSLSSPGYRAKVGNNGNFLLEHGTGNLPAKGEIDAPLVYGDYYYLEGLMRFKGISPKATR